MDVKTSKKDYELMVKTKAPKTKTARNCFIAFAVGGLICALGQAITNFLMSQGLDEISASGATSIILIFLGALTTGLGWYDKLAYYAGAGTMVPISGFANAVVSPALEFKTEGYVTGMAAKMFVIAGPVLVYGVSVSVIIGLVAWFIGLF